MFAKLLKYEWRATRGFLGLMLIISLSAAVVGGLTLQYLIRVSQTPEYQNLLTVLLVLLLMASFAALVICAAASVCFTLWRFYRSRFTQEGYLTFTLPVTTHQVLLSSFVNCLLGILCALATLAIGYVAFGLVVFATVPVDAPRWDILVSLFQSVAWFFTDENAPLFWQFSSQLLISGVCELVIIMLCITLGVILAKRHRVIVGVASYYGIHVLLSLINGALSVLGDSSLLVGTSASLTTSLLISTLLSVVVGVASYFCMYYLVDRKLNLT